MPKVELTMNQWGLVLGAVRRELATFRKLYADEVPANAIDELLIAEGRIIDMAFNVAKHKRVYFIRDELGLLTGFNAAGDKNGPI